MKKKNKNGELSEFIRYIRGEMSGREENAFQRKLQKDPFIDEAIEGYSEVLADEAVNDLKTLDKRLKKKTAGRQRMIYYRIAASVAVLMIISSVFLIINRNRPAHELSGTAAVQAPVELPPSDDTREKNVEAVTQDIAAGQEEIEDVTPQVSEELHEEIPAQEITEEIKDAQVAEVAVRSENEPLPPSYEPALNAAGAPAAKAASIASLRRPANIEVRGTVISTEDNQPVPGANISLKGSDAGVITDSEGKFRITLADTVNPVLVANFIGMEQQEFRATEDTDMKINLTPSLATLNEVVVVGYGRTEASKAVSEVADEAMENELSGYSSPEPENGKQSFDRYIEDNIRNPAALPSGQRAVVVLNFLVKSSGVVDSIMVIRSPGKEFSEEAIRLIREGPGWKPAKENGLPIDDEVRIRIVFK